ncbi:hypothetical protein B0H34DRAFT_802561 [Crassisporium funariophilum]|nr:hypothetical protein B0H34DRAFT_802561 [Crassisporium funariophilum]
MQGRFRIAAAPSTPYYTLTQSDSSPCIPSSQTPTPCKRRPLNNNENQLPGVPATPTPTPKKHRTTLAQSNSPQIPVFTAARRMDPRRLSIPPFLAGMTNHTPAKVLQLWDVHADGCLQDEKEDIEQQALLIYTVTGYFPSMPRLLKRIKDWRLKSKGVTLREATDVSENELSPLSIEFEVPRSTVDTDTEQGWFCPFEQMPHINPLSPADFPQANLHEDTDAFLLQCLTRTTQITDNGLTDGLIAKNQLNNKEQVVANPKQLVSMSYHTTTSSPLSFDQQATHTVSSGITTLPYEILSHIFVIYTFEDEKFNPRVPFLHPDKSNGPLHICSISRQWRQIALTTPILWSSIFVGHHPDLRLVKLWLERSRSYPLTFRLEPEPRRDKTPEDLRFTEAAFSLFSTQLHRWRSISLHLQDSTAKAFLALPLSNATLLDQAVVNAGRCGFETCTLVFAALSAFPRLRWLTWLGRRYIPPVAESTFWSQLTSIDLICCRVSIFECVTLLRHCPNTSRLSIWNVSDGQLQKDYPHTTLLHLQELIVGGSEYDFSGVFNLFNMPALHYLSVRHNSTGNCYSNLRGLLDRSGCRLQRFALNDHSLTQLDVITFFRDSVIRSIPRVTFNVTPRSMDYHACLAALKESSFSHVPVFGKHEREAIYMGWGEPCFNYIISIEGWSDS